MDLTVGGVATSPSGGRRANFLPVEGHDSSKRYVDTSVYLHVVAGAGCCMCSFMLLFYFGIVF